MTFRQVRCLNAARASDPSQSDKPVVVATGEPRMHKPIELRYFLAAVAVAEELSFTRSKRRSSAGEVTMTAGSS